MWFLRTSFAWLLKYHSLLTRVTQALPLVLTMPNMGQVNTQSFLKSTSLFLSQFGSFHHLIKTNIRGLSSPTTPIMMSIFYTTYIGYTNTNNARIHVWRYTLSAIVTSIHYKSLRHSIKVWVLINTDMRLVSSMWFRCHVAKFLQMD